MRNSSQNSGPMANFTTRSAKLDPMTLCGSVVLSLLAPSCTRSTKGKGKVQGGGRNEEEDTGCVPNDPEEDGVHCACEGRDCVYCTVHEWYSRIVWPSRLCIGECTACTGLHLCGGVYCKFIV